MESVKTVIILYGKGKGHSNIATSVSVFLSWFQNWTTCWVTRCVTSRVRPATVTLLSLHICTPSDRLQQSLRFVLSAAFICLFQHKQIVNLSSSFASSSFSCLILRCPPARTLGGHWMAEICVCVRPFCHHTCSHVQTSGIGAGWRQL